MEGGGGALTGETLTAYLSGVFPLVQSISKARGGKKKVKMLIKTAILT